MRRAPAEHWGIYTTLLGRYLALRARRGDFRRQRQCRKELDEQLRRAEAMDQQTLFGKEVSEDERMEAYSVATWMGKCNLEETKQLLGEFERGQALAQARGPTAQRQILRSGLRACGPVSWEHYIAT
eukprot:5863827-Pyramimonas_sp.AAC.1